MTIFTCATQQIDQSALNVVTKSNHLWASDHKNSGRKQKQFVQSRTHTPWDQEAWADFKKIKHSAAKLKRRRATREVAILV